MNPDPATPWPVFGTAAPTWPPSPLQTTVSPVCSLPDRYVVVPTLATTVFGSPPPGSPPHPASTPASTTPIATLLHIPLRRYTGRGGFDQAPRTISVWAS